jgi:glycosyltransferase involved in cell wall biosynthesis
MLRRTDEEAAFQPCTGEANPQLSDRNARVHSDSTRKLGAPSPEYVFPRDPARSRHGTGNDDRPPRFSIVIPTYQRRDVVTDNVVALSRQEFEGGFEVIVVVDGSTDGTAAALRALEADHPLQVIEQPNGGAAAARNRGASAARGEILLFLDDDMEAHPRLLAEHDRSHRHGADVVLGHLPLHPRSPETAISRKVGSWAEGRLARLSAPGAQLGLHDLLTGQISIARALFAEVGAFDTDFTEDGSFGNEDVDLGYRLWKRECDIVFNPDAISWQRYVVRPRAYLKQWYEAGKADVLFSRKHPDQTARLFRLNGIGYPRNRYFWRPLHRVPLLATMIRVPLREATVGLVERGATGRIVDRLVTQVRSAEYWRGVRDAGGVPRQPKLRVLAYHAIRDLGDSGVLWRYGVPADLFRRQLDTLVEAGFVFIPADDFLAFLQRRTSLPDRAVLLTFDDCYADLLETALPILLERRIPAVAFAVSGLVGATNQWDLHLGAPELPLLAADGLRDLSSAGVEIGAHSRTHPQLNRIGAERLPEEVEGSVDELERFGLPRPRLFSYPHGEHDGDVRDAVRSAALDAAFTVEPGLVSSATDPLRVPRIEVLRDDGCGRHFWWKIATAGGAIRPTSLPLLLDLWRGARCSSRAAT